MLSFTYIAPGWQFPLHRFQQTVSCTDFHLYSPGWQCPIHFRFQQTVNCTDFRVQIRIPQMGIIALSVASSSSTHAQSVHKRPIKMRDIMWMYPVQGLLPGMWAGGGGEGWLDPCSTCYPALHIYCIYALWRKKEKPLRRRSCASWGERGGRSHALWSALLNILIFQYS